MNADYWTKDWPKIVFQTFGHGGRMFESIEQKDGHGFTRYIPGRELTLDEALMNSRPDRRVMTVAVFEGTGKKVEE